MQTNKRFWNFTPPPDDNSPAELVLYGDIAKETWWGDEITPRVFSDELRSLGNVSEIVVRINSGGGDVFAANAIYTRLKDHPARITVKIDGWAASAATIVAMAGDVIQIPGNALFMVHKAKMGLLGYYGEEDFAKMTAEIQTINQAIVNGYTLRTGKTAEEVAEIMAAEKWFDGKEAVAAGFCDELMFEAEVETTVENSSRIIVNSVPLDLSRYQNIPVTLLNRFAPHPQDGFTNKPNNIKERSNMEIKTVKDLQAAYPDLTKQIANDAAAAERKRFQDIEEVSLPGYDNLVQAAKFTSPISAEALSMQIIAEQKKQGVNYVADRDADVRDGNVNDAGTAGQEGPAPADVDIDAVINKVLPPAQN